MRGRNRLPMSYTCVKTRPWEGPMWVWFVLCDLRDEDLLSYDELVRLSLSLEGYGPSDAEVSYG